MHHRGQTHSAPLTQTVTLPRPNGDDWTFLIQPLPLGFQRRLRTRGLIAPLPPHRVARDSTGRPIRDDSGHAVTTTDTTDAQYLADLELYHQRVAVLAVTDALRADPHVTFDTVLPATDDPQAWIDCADALYAELEQAGFTAGDLILLCNAVCRLSNLLGDHLQQAGSNFSSRVPTPPT